MAFFNNAVETSRTRFEAQFESDGDGYIYRMNQKGVPKRVTPAEREAFVAAFAKGYRRMLWGMVVAMVALVVGGGILSSRLALESGSSVVVYGVTAFAVVGITMSVMWLWRAPQRALERRTAIGSARTPDEARQILLSNMSWGQIGGGGAMVAVLLFNQSRKHDLLSGWYRLWLVGGGLMILLFAVRAWQKWRLEQFPQD